MRDVKGSKPLISGAVWTLRENVERTGDPLGFRSDYWTPWAKGLGLPREGRTILFTARMYQMLPYVMGTTELMKAAKPLLATRGLNRIMTLGNRLAGERVIQTEGRRGDGNPKERGPYPQGNCGGIAGYGFGPRLSV